MKLKEDVLEIGKLSVFLGNVLPPYVLLFVRVFVISQFFSNIERRRTTSYDVAGLILMSPIDC